MGAMFTEQLSQDRWREYCATVMWSIGRLLGGEEYPIPAYSEYLNPKVQDNRTGAQIISGLREKLKQGVKKNASDGIV